VQIANLHLDPLRTWTIGQKLTLPFQLRRQRDIHRNELAQVFENLRPGSPTILLGDFNRASDAAIDRLRELGFIDSFAVVTPGADRVPTLHFRFSVFAREDGLISSFTAARSGQSRARFFAAAF
jgi:endonuclease/exonuclease/phosphatase (EEP) superfamily protein YafD